MRQCKRGGRKSTDSRTCATISRGQIALLLVTRYTTNCITSECAVIQEESSKNEVANSGGRIWQHARATSSASRPASNCFSTQAICASVCLLLDITSSPFFRSNATQLCAETGEHVIGTWKKIMANDQAWLAGDRLERLVQAFFGLASSAQNGEARSPTIQSSCTSSGYTTVETLEATLRS
jgi:hypothetical protein